MTFTPSCCSAAMLWQQPAPILFTAVVVKHGGAENRQFLFPLVHSSNEIDLQAEKMISVVLDTNWLDDQPHHS
jgi:hypothetical protein